MPPAAPASLRQRQQARVRADLVDAALNVVSDGGIEAATIDAIVAAAGTARATLYAHFANGRDELLAEAYREAGRRLLAIARASSEGARWDDRILIYARVMLDYSTDEQLGHFYTVTGPALLGARTERGVGAEGYREVLHDALTDGIELGEVSADIDTDAIALLLASSLRDAAIENSRGDASTDRYVAAMARLVDGLRP